MLYGTYVYGDSCSSNIWFATYDGTAWHSTLFDTLPGGWGTIVSFGEDEPGDLYVVDQGESKIYKFSLADTITYLVSPFASQGGRIIPDTPQTVNEGDMVHFMAVLDSGYQIAWVSGEGCDVIVKGGLLTTAPTTADCEVRVGFSINPDVIFSNGFDQTSTRVARTQSAFRRQ